MTQPDDRPDRPDRPDRQLAPAPLPQAAAVAPAGRPHLVVVRTRAVEPRDRAPDGTVLLTRFWHPRDQRWSENFFESLEHAFRLFTDESGWVLRQQQRLDGPHAHELIFEARRADFNRPSTEQMLRDVGMSPEDVADLLGKLNDEPPAGGSAL